MDILNAIPLIGPALAVLVPFIVVLSIVVAIHELGHLMVGRWCGIKAEVFSIGFGRKIWQRTDRHGTTWQVAILPLGGFVKFLGDMDPASAGKADDAEIPAKERHRAFHNAALWKRSLTVVAGPVANFLLSFLIFAILALQAGKWAEDPVIHSLGSLHSEEIGFEVGDRVLRIGETEVETFADVTNALFLVNGEPTEVVVERDGERVAFTTEYRQPPTISGLEADGAAVGAGLRPGDIVRSIDGEKINSAREIQLLVADLPKGEEITFEIERPGEDGLLTYAFTPKIVERAHPETGEVQPMPFLGIRMTDTSGLAPETVPVGIGEAAVYGVEQVWRIIRDTLLFVNEMLFHGADTSQLAGPIGIAKHSANAAEAGWLELFQFVAFVSTAIGLFNLFPIPILDGGHLCFYAVEAVRRKPASDAIVKYSTMAGLSLLLLLMVFVTFNNDLGLGDWFVQN